MEVRKCPSLFYFALYSQTMMHRKFNSTYADLSSFQPLRSSSLYDSALPTPTADSHLPSGLRLRDSIIKGATDSTRSHTRKFSDLFVKDLGKGEGMERGQQGMVEMSVVRRLEERIDRIEGRLSRNQVAVGKLGIEQHRFSNEFLAAQVNAGKEIELKQKQIKICLTDIGESLLNVGKFNQENLYKVRPIDTATDRYLARLGRLQEEMVNCFREEIKAKFNELSEKIKKIGNTTGLFKINRKYSGNSISFLYEEYIKKNTHSPAKQPTLFQELTKRQQPQNFCMNQVVYHIDPEGFLLDEDNNYLVNSHVKQIKLSQKQMGVLRKLGLLENKQ